MTKKHLRNFCVSILQIRYQKNPPEQLLSCNSENIEIKQSNAYIRSNKWILRGTICGLQDCLLLFWTALSLLQV